MMKNRAAIVLGAAVLLVQGLIVYGCTGSETVGSSGQGGSTVMTGSGGSNATTGSGGSNATTGAGGSTTTGAGGSTTGAGGGTVVTSGSGGSTGTTGAGGSTGAGGTTGTTGSGGSTGTTGAGGSTGAGGTPGTTGAGGSGPSTDPNCTSTNAKTGATCTVDCIIPCGYAGLGTKTCTCAAGVYSACPCPKPPAYMGAATAPYCAGDGLTTTIKNTACTTEWQECIGKDLVSGTTPQGCVCMTDPLTAMRKWYCGSTNKWFALAP